MLGRTKRAERKDGDECECWAVACADTYCVLSDPDQSSYRPQSAPTSTSSTPVAPVPLSTKMYISIIHTSATVKCTSTSSTPVPLSTQMYISIIHTSDIVNTNVHQQHPHQCRCQNKCTSTSSTPVLLSTQTYINIVHTSAAVNINVHQNHPHQWSCQHKCISTSATSEPLSNAPHNANHQCHYPDKCTPQHQTVLSTQILHININC